MQDGTTYMEMTEEDLNSCQQRGDQYYCPLLGKFKRAWRSCLMLLYSNVPEEVQQDCPLTVGRPEARVERIDKSNWLLIEPEPTELRIQCTNGYNYRTDVHGYCLYVCILPHPVKYLYRLLCRTRTAMSRWNKLKTSQKLKYFSMMEYFPRPSFWSRIWKCLGFGIVWFHKVAYCTTLTHYK